MNAAVALRHELHAHPELSGQERATAERLRRFFARFDPDATIAGIGGTGVAFVFGPAGRGPTVVLRAELDALPVQEVSTFAHRSRQDGVAHLCGHDGHMAILAEVGRRLAAERPPRGRVVLLFQPAEETGNGAAAVVTDVKFAGIRPDRIYGLHNLPGYPLGRIVVRDGTFTCASRGLRIALRGSSAHAAEPENGSSPALGMARIIADFCGLPEYFAGAGDLAFATVVGAAMGGPNFGLVPESAEICATLRGETDTTMAAVAAYCERRVAAIAAEEQLTAACAYRDVFHATVNATPAVATIRRACRGPALREAARPFRWSEDFGRYTRIAEGAFFGLGAGSELPALHQDGYDFPDALIDIGAAAMLRIVRATFEELSG